MTQTLIVISHMPKPVLASAGGRHYNSEDFNTAGRSIKTGLIAVDVRGAL